MTEARGDCFEAAVHYLMEHGTLGLHRGSGNANLVIVHGEVSGQGPLDGVRYGHAWVEDGETVIDTSNGRDIRMPKAVYYAIGRIAPPFTRRPANLHRYTAEQARERMLATGVYGPWDLKTSTGL